MSFADLSPSDLSLLPTAADVAFYREHGYWISPEIIPVDVLDAAERGMRRHYANDLDAHWPVVPTDWQAGDGDGLRKNDYASLRVRELATVVRTPLLGATAALLSGSESIRLWHDQLLYKPVEQPGTPANVGWHTDRQYWLTCSSPEMLTAWIGFHDVDEVGGSVSFVPGSHRWDVPGLDFFRQDLAGLETALGGRRVPRQPVTLRRGQVSFHHSGTVHGSGPNRAAVPRRSLAVHLQPAENRWQAAQLSDGTPATHANDRFVRRVDGVPDYTDPRVCPVLWP